MLMRMKKGNETKSVSAEEFAERPLALLEEVARTGEPLDVTREGKLLVRVVAPARSSDVHDDLVGSVRILGDIVSPTEEWESA